MLPNIRQNNRFVGVFYLKNTEQRAYGYLKIKNGMIYLFLIGNVFVNSKSHKIISTSKDGNIIGLLNCGYKVVTRNFESIDMKISSGNVPFCVFHVFSISFFDHSCESPELNKCNQILINIDNLSHFLYLPKLFNVNDNKINLCNVKFHGINYLISVILSTNSYSDLNRLKKYTKSWINFSITSHNKNWNKYKNIIPLSTIINKFIRLMTRINTNKTSIIENNYVNKHQMKQSIYVSQASSSKHIGYTGRSHYLSFISLSQNFRNIFKVFLNSMINNSNTKSLINAILLVNLNDQNILENNLIDCTNAIESYYSNECWSLRHKINNLINSIPPRLRKLVFGKINIKQFIWDIKDTRVYIVHGSKPESNSYDKGIILKGVDLSMDCNVLRWIIYIRILLDIKVPNNNIYMELWMYMNGANSKSNYSEYKY